MTSSPWFVPVLARLIPAAHRDAIVDDLVEDFRTARETPDSARGAHWRLARDLFTSAIDSRRQARLDRLAERGRAGSLAGDFRAAWRQHRRQAAGTVSALVTIALALGVNTALVSVVRATLLRPLTFKDPSRVVFIWDTRKASGPEPLPPGRALDFAHLPRSLQSAALLGNTAMTVTGLGPAERWSGASVSRPFFDVLGAGAAIGRVFHADDPDRDVLVLSYRWWSERFGGDPSVVGRSLIVNGRARTIVGVMPLDFFWPAITGTPSAANGPDFWACAPATDVPEGPIPSNQRVVEDRQSGYVRLVARLADGATIAGAQEELASIAVDLGREYPESDAGHGAVVVPARDQFFGAVRQPLVFLLLASALVVVLACINVGNLLAMRLTARGREFAVRTALGASRWQLARQLLVEGLMLAGVGGTAGIVLARLSLRTIASLAPVGLGHLDRLAIDPVVLGAAAAAILGCGFFLGVMPAIVVWRSRPALDLRASGVALATRPRARQALVAIEVAVALTLVVGATLFGQSLLRLERVDVGFDTRGLLTFDLALAGDRAESQKRQVAFFEDVFREIRALPGVTSAAGAVTLPVGGDDFSAPLFVEGRPLPALGQEPHVGLQLIGAGWFDTLGMRVLSGRDFTTHDDSDHPPVVLINETLAARMWPGEDALGKRARFRPDATARWFTVVGVVSDIRHRGPASAPRPEIYRPYYQTSLPFLAVAVRSAGDPLELVGPIRAAIAKLDPAQPISGVSTMADHLTRAYGDERFLSILTLSFGTLALLLALVGVYGVVGWSSAQRMREFGLRMALGASPASLSALILRQGLGPVVLGAGLGAVAALVLARAISGLLFDTAAADPAIYAIASITVIAAATIACWIPARRAAHVDPVRSLTAEP